jgi:iron complex transport system substrate-binding protein
VAAWNPDVIFVVAYATPVDEAVKTLKADTQWQGLKAVKDNKVYGFATDIYSWDQPDTRWILGLEWAAIKLHPDLFKDLDIIKESKEFYKELYGMEDAAYTKDIQPTLKGDVK